MVGATSQRVRLLDRAPAVRSEPFLARLPSLESAATAVTQVTVPTEKVAGSDGAVVREGIAASACEAGRSRPSGAARSRRSRCFRRDRAWRCERTRHGEKGLFSLPKLHHERFGKRSRPGIKWRLSGFASKPRPPKNREPPLPNRGLCGKG